MTTKQVFDERQPRISISKSGRAMVALNEQVVTTRETVPVGMDDDGVMRQEEHEKTQYAYDVCWLNDVQHEVEALGASKTAVLSAIEAYDASDSVNAFILDGQRGWLDKDTRMGLRQNVADRRVLGRESIVIWVDGKPHSMNLDRAEGFLRALENYAYACKAVTSEHKAKVAAMETIEEVLVYDYREGYPSIIHNS